MISRIIKSVSAVCLSFLMVTACQSTAIDSDKVTEAGVYKLRQADSTTFAAGQPSKEQFSALKQAGIAHVINLRTEPELKFDEQGHVESLGMAYHSLPIKGKQGITFKNANKLSELIAATKGKPTLVHCGSSNRVGALIALDTFKQNGGDVEAAVAEGKRWGMTKLEPFVRKKLDNSAK